MKLSRWQRWARDLLIFAVIFYGIQWWQTRDLPKQEMAPALAGFNLTGEPISLAQYRGQTVLAHFWATWCTICRLEEGSIASIAEDYPVIAVATSSGSAEEVQAYLSKQGIKLPVMLDTSGELANFWNVRGTPTSFVIDSQGLVTHATMGYTTELSLRWRLWLAD